MKNSGWMKRIVLLIGAGAACQAAPTAPDDAMVATDVARRGEATAEALPLYGFDRPAAGRRGCRGAGFRAFDFWVGRWAVVDPTNPATHFGTNVVSREVDGCAIEERWTDVGGGRGRSLNTFDSGTGEWHQLWIDHSGGALVLAGKAAPNGVMSMAGSAPEFIGGPPVATKLSWARRPNREVLQTWDLSRDGGTTFETVFQGRYRRLRDVEPAPEVVNPFCGAATRVRFHWFDFLVGEWEVRTPGPGGQVAGVMRVRKDVSDCLVESRFEGHHYEGTAFSLFQFSTLTWHRTWVDQDGVRLSVSGGLVGGAMVMTGTRRVGPRTELIRATWTPVDPALVEERWETSADEGTIWVEARRFELVRRP